MLEPPVLLTFVASQSLGVAAFVFTMMAAVVDNDHTVVETDENPAEYTFVWHPVLMSAGMSYLFGCSAVMFRVIRSVDKFHTKLLHTVIHCVALVISLAGFYLAVAMYSAYDSPHFQTIHGMLGLATVGLFAAQWVISIPVFLWPRAPASIRAPGISVHICVGTGVFVCAAICCLTGFNSREAKTESSKTYYKVAGLLHVAFTLVVLYMLSVRKYKRPPEY
uniref:Cytochrome b ascorbate-dependent protein 3 n=1 Tax=Lygus hesperus TaxID=30085 RepID=A0A146KUG5_LYGHE